MALIRALVPHPETRSKLRAGAACCAATWAGAAVTLSVGGYRIRVRLGLGRPILWLCRIWSRGRRLLLRSRFFAYGAGDFGAVLHYLLGGFFAAAVGEGAGEDLPAKPRLETAIPQRLKPK